MKCLKICFLLSLTLLTMRAASWGVAWAAVRLVAANVRIVAVAANFVGFAAILFGLFVFMMYTVSDLFWRPWERRTRPPA